MTTFEEFKEKFKAFCEDVDIVKCDGAKFCETEECNDCKFYFGQYDECVISILRDVYDDMVCL